MNIKNVIHRFFQTMFVEIIDPKEMKSLYILLVFSLIIISLLLAVSIYCYMIKFKAKQKRLLPFYVRNNKLIKIYFKNGREK